MTFELMHMTFFFRGGGFCQTEPSRLSEVVVFVCTGENNGRHQSACPLSDSNRRLK